MAPPPADAAAAREWLAAAAAVDLDELAGGLTDDVLWSRAASCVYAKINDGSWNRLDRCARLLDLGGVPRA